jgi:hypothetical protein
MNQIPPWNRGGFSPYNLYFEKNCLHRTSINFGKVAAKNGTMEYGVFHAKSLCLNAQKKNSGKMVMEDLIISAMWLGV